MKTTIHILIAGILLITGALATSCSVSKVYTGPHTLNEGNIVYKYIEVNRGGALPGLEVGKVTEVNYNRNEVTVRQNKPVAMGSVVYVLINGKEVMMMVNFSMQTVFKCMVVANQRQFLKDIKKGNPVYMKQ